MASSYIYSLSLHDALPIYTPSFPKRVRTPAVMAVRPMGVAGPGKNVTGVVPVSRPNSSPSPDQGAPFYSAESYDTAARSEEQTSELQSLRHLVCRLLLEKK